MTEILTINGKDYPVSQFGENGVSPFKYLCPTRAGEIVGFKGRSDLLAWADNEGAKDRARRALGAETQAKGRANEMMAAEAKWKRTYQVQAEFGRWQTQQVMRQQKITAAHLERPPVEAMTHSLLINLSGSLIYSKPNFKGYWLYLWYGWHPKLSWYGDWNDAIDSVRVWGEYVHLYQHTWWRGWCLVLLWDWPWLGWFSDRASSAIVG